MKSKKYIITLLLFVSSLSIKAQHDLTMHLMQAIPQSSYTNPAFVPDARIHVGFPLLSSIYYGFGNTGTKVSKNLVRFENDSTLIVDNEKMYKRLHKKNYVMTKAEIDLVNFGFKILDDNYINFNFALKTNSRFCYPKDLVMLPSFGNSSKNYLSGNEYLVNMNGLGFNYNLYYEFGIGYARTLLNGNLTIGIKPKLLFGVANVYTKRSNFSFGTDTTNFDYTINSDYEINTSVPLALTHNSITKETPFTDGTAYSIAPNDFFLDKKKMGIGVDFGATYNINKKFTVNASIIDLGYIKWNRDVNNYTNDNATFKFEGFDVFQVFGTKGDSTNAGNTITHFVDSIATIFKPVPNHNAYKSPLGTKVYLSGAYNLKEKDGVITDRVGLLIKSEFYDKALHPAFSLSYNKKVGNILSFTGAYSIANRNFFNIGLGLGLNLGPIQLYWVTDNIIGIFAPAQAKLYTVHCGMNLIFGYKEKTKRAENAPQMN